MKILLLISTLTTTVMAFTSGPFSLSLSSSLHSTSHLYSSSFGKPENPFDEDEMSKLMSKREQIKKQKKKAPKPKTEEDYLKEIQMEPPKTLEDLEKMPELKTKRPIRKPKKKSNDSKKKKKEDDKSSEDAVDFLSEYEDENDLHIPNRIGFSTAAWGDVKRGFVAEGKLSKKMQREGKFLPGDLQVAYNNLMEAGVSFVHTSEMYGKSSRSSKLSAEHILGRCMEENADYTPIVADTYSCSLKNGIRLGGKAVANALDKSCNRMGQSSIELYQVQRSLLYPGGKTALADGLALAMDRGSCNYVGVVNVGRGAMKSFARKLDKRGVQLTSNQFHFSLTNRKAWKSGLIDECKNLGVIPLVTDPLDGGLATGKYTATNPSGGDASGTKKYSFEMLEKLQELHSVQETVAERASIRVKREQRDLSDRFRSRYGPPPKINTDITTTQVAINYVIAKGCVPLVDVTKPKQAEELIGCLGWALTEEEVDMLDAAASLCNR